MEYYKGEMEKGKGSIGAIQRLQYPVLMFGGMIAVCVAVSVVILKLHEIICDRKGKNRSFAWN